MADIGDGAILGDRTLDPESCQKATKVGPCKNVQDKCLKLHLPSAVMLMGRLRRVSSWRENRLDGDKKSFGNKIRI
jgi:hypothetical protein